MNANMTAILKDRMVLFKGVWEPWIRHLLPPGVDVLLVGMSGA